MSPASSDPATQVGTAFDAGQRAMRLRVPLIWGVVFGLLQAAAPLGLWWLRPATVYAIRQHRTGFVNNTRWWPPFCLTVDWVAAAIVAIAITAGVDFG
jgi:hypothetical protein